MVLRDSKIDTKAHKQRNAQLELPDKDCALILPIFTINVINGWIYKIYVDIMTEEKM